MSNRRLRLTLLFTVILCALAVRVTPADQTLIAAASSWKYNATGTDLGTAWRAAAYDDTSWPSGLAQLGYGDGDESTVLPFGGDTNNRWITYYFRRSFTVDDPAAVAALSLRFIRDDGCVIYLNGVEVVRSNMPAGTVSFSTLATSAIGGTDESAWQQSPVDPSRLVSGTNVIAVEIHQQAATSSDISFDLELTSTPQNQGPAVTLLTPANNTAVNTTSVTFTGSATAAAGLASATLYLGGPPQTITFSGTSQVQDTYISADQPTVNYGAATSLNVDGQTPHAHGLIKFPALIGSGAGQVPAASVISSASLRLNCTNSGAVMKLYRLTEDWAEDQATWNQRSNGNAWGSPGADGAGSNAGVAVNGDCTSTGQRQIDVTTFVQEWSNGSPNFGIVLVDSGTDGVDFDSSESANGPLLTVTYKGSQQPVQTQTLSGTSASLSFPLTLVAGQTYFWNILVTATGGQQSWAAADFQVTVDTSAPNDPVLVSPSNGATGVPTSPTLAALVSDPGGGSLNVTFSGRPAAAGEFTIIALPDTQYYSQLYPSIYTTQTQWIVDNKAARNIVFVTHLGDLVQNYNAAAEWQNANTSMSLLDNVVPYGMGPGNHDQPTTLFNQTFPYTRYQGQPWYGGHMGSTNDNNYELFSGGGINFVIVHLEFCPSTAEVAYADSILKTYPNRIGIFTTHGYLGLGGVRSVNGCSNTQYLWDGLAATNPNLYFMLCGHVHGEAQRTDTANGHPVIQMLADYQDLPSGGQGWLRILRFVPAENKVYVQTYSPWLNQYQTDADSEFTWDFQMGGAFSTLGTVTVPSGSTASLTPAGLPPSTPYEWKVTVTNGTGKSKTGPVWGFTTGTGGASNQPPVASNQSVSTLEDTSAPVVLAATDLDNNPLTYAVVTNPSHGTLTGSAPNLTYQPATNYNGTDSFTFRANDGQANSNTANVSITVQVVNDAPVSANDSYSVQVNGTLNVNTPGVLSNDTDVDSASLTVGLVTSSTHGTLTLNSNGSFTYTPTSGYIGSDSFTYRASDGQATSGTATVNLTVTAATPIFTANFNSGQDSFTYVDNTFRGTNQASYASGSRVATGGFTGGALRVVLGGINNTTITGMSGGWRRTFTLSAATALTLSFRYNLNQGADYESDEFSQVMASIDGVLKGVSPNDYVAQVTGNGNGGAAITTGWQQVQISLGTLPAGTHTLILGGYNNKKNSATESTTILIDDVTVRP